MCVCSRVLWSTVQNKRQQILFPFDCYYTRIVYSRIFGCVGDYVSIGKVNDHHNDVVCVLLFLNNYDYLSQFHTGTVYSQRVSNENY